MGEFLHEIPNKKLGKRMYLFKMKLCMNILFGTHNRKSGNRGVEQQAGFARI